MTPGVKYPVRFQYWTGAGLQGWTAGHHEHEHADMQDWKYLVYEVYAADGSPIYVGMTRNIKKRMVAHRKASAWWPWAVSLAVTLVPCAELTRQYEWARIGSLTPPFNKARNMAWPEQRGRRMAMGGRA